MEKKRVGRNTKPQLFGGNRISRWLEAGGQIEVDPEHLLVVPEWSQADLAYYLPRAPDAHIAWNHHSENDSKKYGFIPSQQGHTQIVHWHNNHCILSLVSLFR